MNAVVSTVERVLDPETASVFDQRVDEQAAQLRAALAAGAFDSSGFAVGLELELYAVDDTERLTRIESSVFGDEYAREIGLHNVECNASPQPFDPDGCAAQAAELRASVAELRRRLATHEQQAVCDGMWTVPPAEGSRTYLDTTESHGDISVDSHDEVQIAVNMPSKPRYCAMDNHLTRKAGGDITVSVPGARHQFSTILVESLTSSIQPHLQIPATDEFPAYFNAAIRTLGPLLALATNSPFLPADLYNAVSDPYRLLDDTPHELRIPVFEQTVNGGGHNKACCPRDIETPADIIDRVVDDWTCGPFLSEWPETPTDEIPTVVAPYWEFTHKYGTYWRWVRAIVGGDAIGDGGSLRIEYRPLPTQPTVEDVLSLQWLTVGLIRGIVAADHPLVDLPWSEAEEGFYNAVDEGLEADLYWITTEGERTRDAAVLYPELFALARRGLCEQGHTESEAETLLAPMVDRFERGETPSQWKKARVREELDAGASLTDAITTMQRTYNRHSRRGEPFASW